MIDIPIIRWGKPYESREKSDVVHFETGEVMAQIHQANAGLVKMDMRKSAQARARLREFMPDALIDMCVKAADLFLAAELPLGNGTQTPDQFCEIQSATTGLPLNMARANMSKVAFVLKNMRKTLEALTRGLPLGILHKGYGVEDRGVIVSYQSTTDALGLVLPSNSPGVHTLWLPAIPLQTGLVLKPGSSEPWTPYRLFEAFAAAGVPREVFCLYPGPHDVGNTVLDNCERAMIFGGQATVDKYSGDRRNITVELNIRGRNTQRSSYLAPINDFTGNRVSITEQVLSLLKMTPCKAFPDSGTADTFIIMRDRIHIDDVKMVGLSNIL